MPGSLTTRSRTASRVGETVHIAFGVGHTLDAPDGITIAARWLAYAPPYRRFAPALADRRARLGADVDRYSFIAEDFHPLSPAGLPAHAWIIQCAPMARFTSGGRSHPESCRLAPVADERHGRATGRVGAS